MTASAIVTAFEASGSVTASDNMRHASSQEAAPLVILPLDLAPLVAGQHRVELWCSLQNTELSRAPYNLKGFTVLICCDKDVLTLDLRRQLNPMRITIVSAQVSCCAS